jgi:hypothetical protein
MRRFALLVLLLAACCAGALAQRSHYYWTTDLGGYSTAGRNSFRAGLNGGGEIAIKYGIAAGPNLGFIAPVHGLFWDTVQGLGSANGYYHPMYARLNRSRWDPFATAGYGVMFRSDVVNMFNYGGGLNYWVGDDIGVRTEFRNFTRSGANLWTFRIGVCFTHLFP